MTPEDRKYTASHEWALLEGYVVTVGITDHAQQELGDITFVELPAIGKEVAAGGELAVIESVKAAGDLYAPVGGKVVEVNPRLADAPEMINEGPYGDGWIVKLEIADPGALDALMDAAAYDAQL